MEYGGKKGVYVVLFGDTNTSISRESSGFGANSETYYTINLARIQALSSFPSELHDT